MMHGFTNPKYAVIPKQFDLFWLFSEGTEHKKAYIKFSFKAEYEGRVNV